MQRSHQFVNKNIGSFVQNHNKQSINQKVPYTLTTNDQGLAWRKCSLLIKSSEQELFLLQSSSWRKNTTMPILHAIDLEIQSKDNYPKTGNILIEHLVQDFRTLNSLSIEHAFYILKETLLAYNTLLYRFGRVRVLKECCGINSKGECRVWIEPQFGKLQAQSPFLTSFKEITEKILELVMVMTKSDKKQPLEIFKCHLKNNQNQTSYFTVYQLILQVVKKLNLKIPEKMRLNSSNKHIFSTAPSSTRPCITFEYQSPKFNNSFQVSKKQNKCEKNSKSHIFFGKQIKNVEVHNHQKLEKYRKAMIGSVKIARSKNKRHHLISYTHKIPQPPCMPFQEVIINQFSILPLTFAQNLKISQQFSHTLRPSSNAQTKVGQNSLSTTQISQRKSESFDKKAQGESKSEKSRERKLDVGRNVVSILIESSKVQESQPPVKSNYDFGGLVQIQSPDEKKISQLFPEAISLKGSEQISESLPITSPHQIQSTIRSPLKSSNMPQKILHQNCWSRKFTGLLHESNDENLQQSICYEEEKQQSVHLTKLEMLGQMGRQVEKSIIPHQ